MKTFVIGTSEYYKEVLKHTLKENNFLRYRTILKKNKEVL